MRDFDEMIYGMICKKNLGFKYHRHIPQESLQFFTQSMEITNDDVEIAKNILKTIDVKTREDLFLGLSCVTLLSSYEKRQMAIASHKDKKVAEAVCEDNLYYYKGFVNRLIIDAFKKKLDFGFCEKLDEKNNPVTYVSLGKVQFSYHNGNTSNTARVLQEFGFSQYQEQEWNRNISMQNGAKEVFTYALHLQNTSKLRFIDETPLQYATSLYNETQKEQDGKQV